MSFVSREGTPDLHFVSAPLQKSCNEPTKRWDPPVFESLPAMGEYEKNFKTDLVQTLGIISSEFADRVRHEISFQEKKTWKSLIGFYSRTRNK